MNFADMKRKRRNLNETSPQEPMHRLDGLERYIQRSKETKMERQKFVTPDGSRLGKIIRNPRYDGMKAINADKKEEKSSSLDASKNLTTSEGVEINERTVNSADRKPQMYKKPDGKLGTRLVPTDKNVIKTESRSYGRIPMPQVTEGKSKSVMDGLTRMRERSKEAKKITRDDMYKGSADAQQADDGWSEGARDFAQLHKVQEPENVDINKVVLKNKEEMKNSVGRRASFEKPPSSSNGVKYRPGDNKQGDRKIIKDKEANK